MMRLGQFIHRRFRRFRNWWYRNRPAPWMDIPTGDPLDNENHGEHNITFVSRHNLAECGVTCPQCNKLAAARGDFKGVRETRLGEALVCASCEEILVAAPDTEHGDHLLDYDKKRFHKFVRISEDQAAVEKYGDDIVLNNEGAIQADPTRVTVRDLTTPEDKPEE